MVRLIVFGASITYGKWDSQGGWIDRLKQFSHGKKLYEHVFQCLVYNLGIPGNTSGDILERFESEARARVSEGEKTIFMFSVGANDSAFMKSRNGFNVLPEKFRENLQKLVEAAGRVTPKIIFVGLPPIDEAKASVILRDSDKVYKNEHIKKYDEIIRAVCVENGIYFIELFDKLTGAGYVNTLQDGIHPTTEGHKMISDIVRNFLIGNKII